jgi:pimeloyl-ACP methyl ester carboxylesterase
LYEPPFIEKDGHPAPFDMQKSRLDRFVSSGDRAGAVRYFMTDVYGAPKPFVAVMPLIMRSSWKKNQSVAHTLPYDLTLMEDWSILRDRSRLVTVPTLVVGGEKSPAPLKDAVAAVAGALPNARRMYLPGQDHNLSSSVVAPVITEFFSTLPQTSTN